MDERDKEIEAVDLIVKAIGVEALRRDSGNLVRDLYAVLMDISKRIGEHMNAVKEEGGA